jgi:acyl-[acyl-carrier-protein]-phospholipid O-acyltransferase / long-chain-fatty-acid--[acyl-carrier-protein] ligase
MVWTAAGVAALVALWMAFAGYLSHARRISFRQGLCYAPLKLFYGIRDDRLPGGNPDRGTLYVVSHRSRIDPALMLSLLPSDTLHILDEASAKSAWLEPFREMARTIAFNAKHVFVSRRLVRHLRGRGRLAVYFPDGIHPDSRAYRLYRAVARIAAAAEARIVPVSVQGSRQTVFALGAAQDAPRHVLAKLRIRSLEPLTIAELVTRSPREQATMAGALYDRVLEADAA